MRLVLDAVVNHTATNHPWFNLHGRHDTVGAGQSPDSPWRSWYVFDDAGGYAGWNGHPSLPVLDFASPEVQRQVYGGPDAIVRHWLRPPCSIDGWRLDVVHMLGEGSGATNNAHHVREFRRAVREENPEAYIVGEHFNEATRWLQGDQEDGAMNYYGFALPLREWLAGVDVGGAPSRLATADFAAWLEGARGRIPHDNQLAQLNLLDSHDTARFFTLLGGDTAAMKLAVTLLFAWPGVPCVYYGDEIGLEGGDDPDCRRCFDWERARWNHDLFEHYRACIALRRARAELRHGACQVLHAGGDVFALARFDRDAATIAAINRGRSAAALRLPAWQLPLEGAWQTEAGQALSCRSGGTSRCRGAGARTAHRARRHFDGTAGSGQPVAGRQVPEDAGHVVGGRVEPVERAAVAGRRLDVEQVVDAGGQVERAVEELRDPHQLEVVVDPGRELVGRPRRVPLVRVRAHARDVRLHGARLDRLVHVARRHRGADFLAGTSR